MKIPALIVLVVILAVPDVATAASNKRDRSRCFVAGARLLAANTQAKVWRGGGIVSGCLRHHDPEALAIYTTPDDESTSEQKIRHVRLAGTYVAFEATCTCHTNDFSVIRRRDLRRSKKAHTLVADTVASGALASTFDIVLRSDGAVAWLGSSYYDAPERRELWKFDGNGVATLDTGNIASTLTFEDKKILWTKDALPQSAELVASP